jgi:cytidine deaminase
VLIGDDQGNLVYEMTVADLLPGAFTPEDLARG